MQNIGTTAKRPLTSGSGLYCYNCRNLSITSSSFSNLNSVKGGAIYVEETSINKLPTDTYGKYKIYSSKFSSCSAVAGGAIYITNP